MLLAHISNIFSVLKDTRIFCDRIYKGHAEKVTENEQRVEEKIREIQDGICADECRNAIGSFKHTLQVVCEQDRVMSDIFSIETAGEHSGVLFSNSLFSNCCHLQSVDQICSKFSTDTGIDPLMIISLSKFS